MSAFSSDGSYRRNSRLLLAVSLIALSLLFTAFCIAADSDASSDSGTPSQERIGGTIEGASTYGVGTSVVLSSDAVLASGASMTVQGTLVVPASIELVISAGSYLTVSGSADVLGNVVIENGSDGLLSGGSLIAAGGSVSIRGITDVEGIMGSTGNGSLSIVGGGHADVSSTGAVFGDVSVSAGSSLYISGALGIRSGAVFLAVAFNVDGDLIVDSHAGSQGFAVDLMETGSLRIDSLVLADGASVSVADSGLSIWDPDDLSSVSDLGGSDTVVITGSADSATPAGRDWSFGSMIEGFSIAASTTSQVIDTGYGTRAYYDEGYTSGQHLHTAVLSISGNVAVSAYGEYTGSGAEPAVSIGRGSPVTVSADGPNGVSIDGALSLRGNISLSLGGSVRISASVLLAYDDGTAPALVFSSGSRVYITSAVDASSGAPGSEMIRNGSDRIYVRTGGSITSPDAIGGDVSSYNLSYYATGSSSIALHHYVPVDDALEAMSREGIRSVSVYGHQYVDAGAAVPSGSSLTLMDGAVLCIGLLSYDPVTLTVSAGAVLDEEAAGAASVHIYDSLFAEKRSCIAASLWDSIDEQVVFQETDASGSVLSDGWVRWSSVRTALSTASPGDVVPLADGISVYTGLTVPEDVTLSANGHSITVWSDASLDVEGTLDLTVPGSSMVLRAASSSSGSSGTVSYSGYLVYTGSLPVAMSDSSTVHSSGASYSIGDRNYLTTARNAAAHIGEADGRYVFIEGDSDGDVHLGGISFSGAEGDSALVVVNGNIASGTVELDHAILAVTAGHSVDATFVHGADSVAVDAALAESVSDPSGIAMLVSHNTTFDADCMRFTGEFADAQDEDASVSFSGNVWIIGTSDLGGAEVSVNGDLSVGDITGDGGRFAVLADSTTVDGSISIKAGSVFGSERLAVLGSVAVGGTLAADVAIIAGTVDSTAEGSSFRSGIAVVGYRSGASLRGTVDSSAYLLASPASSLSLTNGSDYASTVLHAGDSVYATVYARAGSAPGISAVPFLDGFSDASLLGGESFEGWLTAERTAVGDGAIGSLTDAYADTSGNEDVTFVYGVTVKALRVERGTHPAAPAGSDRAGYTIQWYIDEEPVDLGSYVVSDPVVIVASYTAAAGPTEGYSTDVRAALRVDDDGVCLMLIATDGRPIPDGTVTVTYLYTSVATTPFGQSTVLLPGSMTVLYTATDRAYAYIELDFASDASASAVYGDIVGASAVFSDGTSSYRASMVSFVFLARS